ncbi:sigma factor-like helix-turn-helix DNA-binding protein [Thermodesulfobacteriota bacterium]
MSDDIIKLRDQKGMTFEALGKRLGISSSTARKRYVKAKQQITGVCGEGNESSTRGAVPLGDIPKPWREPLKAMIRREVKEILSRAVTAPDEIPPEFPRSSRRMGPRKSEGERVTLTELVVDAELGRLFDELRKEYGGDASRTMEFILWHHFGKPPLSFEAPIESTEEEGTPRTTIDMPDIDRA